MAYAQTNVAPQIDSTGPFAVVEGSTAVATLSATDLDTPSAELVWSIPDGAAGGADADKFTLSTGGVLAFAAAKDYENADDDDADGVYAVVVQVSDGTDSDTADLEVMLENAVELLSEVSGPASIDFEENRSTRVAAYGASSDEDRDGVEWSLSGDDGGDFSIDGGVLRFAAIPDYEEPADADDGNDYSVTVTAWVGTSAVSKVVTVTVTDGDDAGSLSLSSSGPEVGTALTASVSDPDGVTVTAWKWERSVGREGWTAIAGAESASYTPTNAVSGHYLRASATYTDGHGEQTAHAVAPNVVLPSHRLSRLDIAGGIRPAMYPAFDPDILHYGIGCVRWTGRDGSLTLTLATADPATRLAVDGGPRHPPRCRRRTPPPASLSTASRSPPASLSTADPATRLAVDGEQVASQNGQITVDSLHNHSDILITLSGSDGASTVYTVHCIESAGFPDLKVTKTPGATGIFEGLIMFRYRPWAIMMDTNGVPRLRIPVTDNGGGPFFRVFPNGDDPFWRYVYTLPIPGTERPANSRRPALPPNAGLTVLDKHFNKVATSIRTVAPLEGTDTHDFVATPDGNYVLMSYEPAYRDLSFLSTELGLKKLGTGVCRLYELDEQEAADCSDWSSREAVLDSAIQVRTFGRSQEFLWNSWDYVALEDCMEHRFPIDYAHASSLQVVDGDFVVSLRGCLRILRIDGDTGAVEWRLGRSMWSRAEWEAGRSSGVGPAPLEIVGDPHGEFCGQHAAQILSNGNLLLFDNGAPCFVNPQTGEFFRQSHSFSRAVEYAIDVDNHEAVFVRHHSLHSTFDRFGISSGHVEVLDNGDWLVSWSRSWAPDETYTPRPNMQPERPSR